LRELESSTGEIAGAVGSLEPDDPRDPDEPDPEEPRDPDEPDPDEPRDPDEPPLEPDEPPLDPDELLDPDEPLEPDEPRDPDEPLEPEDPTDALDPVEPEGGSLLGGDGGGGGGGGGGDAFLVVVALGHLFGLRITSSHSPSTAPLLSASTQVSLSEHQPQNGSFEQDRQLVYSTHSALRHDWKNHSVQLAGFPSGPLRFPGKHSSVLSHHPHPFRTEQPSQFVEEQDWAIVCDKKRVARRNSSHRGLIII